MGKRIFKEVKWLDQLLVRVESLVRASRKGDKDLEQSGHKLADDLEKRLDQSDDNDKKVLS